MRSDIPPSYAQAVKGATLAKARKKKGPQKRYISVNSKKLQQILPAGFAALLNQGLDFLGTRSGGNHERIRGINNDDIVHSKTGDESARDGDHDSSGSLLGYD